MDYDALRAGFEPAIPFNVHLGLRVKELAPGRGVVVLPVADHLTNHVGSQHAGALFTAGEAASGGAFLASFAQRMGELTPLAESAEIAYRKIARGEITATATLGTPVDEVNAGLDSEGKARFDVGVVLTDADGNTVAEMTVRWYVRRNPAS